VNAFFFQNMSIVCCVLRGRLYTLSNWKGKPMPSNARFFSDAERETVKARYGYTCAACGSRDARTLEADHWQSFDGSNTTIANAVCLCGPCNRAKGAIQIPGKPLAKRAALKVVSVDEYFLQVEANRDAFATWAEVYRGKAKKKPTHFVAPF
jgi:hypothetical protein